MGWHLGKWSLEEPVLVTEFFCAFSGSQVTNPQESQLHLSELTSELDKPSVKCRSTQCSEGKGNDTKLNQGMCWPRVESLCFTSHYFSQVPFVNVISHLIRKALGACMCKGGGDVTGAGLFMNKFICGPRKAWCRFLLMCIHSSIQKMLSICHVPSTLLMTGCPHEDPAVGRQAISTEMREGGIQTWGWDVPLMWVILPHQFVFKERSNMIICS